MVRRHDAPNYWIPFLHEPVDAMKDPEREVVCLHWPEDIAAERERWAAICRGVMAEHGGDPAGQLADHGNRERLLAQCQAAGASQVLIRGLGA